MGVYKYDAQNNSLDRIAGGTLFSEMPIGSYIPFGGTAIPTGWLLCNGQAVSRTDYADLFAVIGTAYGSGDGSTTFNIPDLREAVPKGAGLTGKSNNHMDADGLAVGEFIDDRIQEHEHDIYIAGITFDQAPNSTASAGGGLRAFNNTGTGNQVRAKNITEGRHGATTEVKSVGSNYIIKAKQIGVPADFVSAVSKMMIPDYSNAQVVINPAGTASTDQTYTCTENGFVTGIISVQNGQPSYTKFYINNILLASCCGKSGVLEGVDGIGLYPVKAGDVLKTTTQANYGSDSNRTTIYFIPCL